MATTLGGVTLPDPAFEYEGSERGVRDIGAVNEMADGTLIYDHVGYRRRFSLHWIGLTSTEKATVWNRYVIKTVQAYSPPDEAGTYNVLVVPDSWREAYIESGGTPLYRVSLALEEQAAT